MKKVSFILLITAVLIFYNYDILCQNTSPPATKTTPSPKKIVLLDNDLGSKLNPVKCDKVAGEKDYLDRLRDPDGNPVIYERIGHAGPTSDGHYYDQFLVKSRDGKLCVEIYVDMYCAGYTETDPIKEFQMDTRIVSVQPQHQTKRPSPSTGHSQSNNTLPGKTTHQQSSSHIKNITGSQGYQGQGTSKKSSTKKKQPTVVDKIPGFDDVPDKPPTKKKKAPQKTSAPPQKTKTTPAPKAKKSPATKNVGRIPGFDDIPSGSTTVKKSSSALNQTYLSRVPVLEPSAGQPVIKGNTPQFTARINNYFNDVFNELEKGSTTSMLINQSNHTIHDKKQEIKKLYNICTGSRDQQEKVEEITTQILDPSAIDLIITGTVKFEKQSGKYLVTPIIISKPDSKLFMSKAFEYNQKTKQSKIEKDFKAQIVNIIKKEFPGILSNQGANPGNTGAKNKGQTSPVEDIYVSIIPFFEPGNLRKTKKKGMAELLDEVVVKEVEAIKNTNSQLEVNDPNHTIHDVRVSVKELNTILSRSNLKDADKAEKIINDMMDPNGIDYIFTVIYSEDAQNDIILVRPHVISKKERKIFSMNLIFQKDELLCSEAQTKEKKLCESAGDNIGAALRMLLGQSVR